MIRELTWDSTFFKRKIGRLISVPPERLLPKLLAEASNGGYQYLACRFVMRKVSEVQILEKYGFYTTDVSVVWERKAGAISDPLMSVRAAGMKDAVELKRMIKGLFVNSRFYNDPFFTSDEADRLYQAWIRNSLHDKDIQTFVVAGKGFITCKRLSERKGDIPLVGVMPDEQGKGVGRSLISRALDWFKVAGIRTVTVRTQANNTRAMNFYKEMGFIVKYAEATMGKILTTEEIK